MLPNLRFIAASVMASVAMMMFGFMLFAAFHLANQSSVLLARTSDYPGPPTLAQGRQQEPSSAAPTPSIASGPKKPVAVVPLAVVLDPSRPEVAEPPKAVLSTEEAVLPTREAMLPTANRPAPPNAPPAAGAITPAEIIPSPANPPPKLAEDASPSPRASADAARPLAAVTAPASVDSQLTEIVGSVKPSVSAKEANLALRSTATRQIKHNRKVAKPRRKSPTRHVVRPVMPKPAQVTIDRLPNWPIANAQWGQQSNWQLTPESSWRPSPQSNLPWIQSRRRPKEAAH